MKMGVGEISFPFLINTLGFGVDELFQSVGGRERERDRCDKVNSDFPSTKAFRDG